MILCCGEALIDMLPEGDCFRPCPGGSVWNVALALGRLGTGSAFLWPLSTDPFGAMLAAPLTEAGVDHTFCPRVDRPTTLAFVTLEAGDARYSFYDEGSAGRMFAPGDLPAIPPTAQALMIGGISLATEPCGSTVEEFATIAAKRIPVFLDPNIRPAFIRDEAALRARLARLMALASAIKLSLEDCNWLWPGLTPAQAAERMLTLGPALVVITDGARGVTAYRAKGSISRPAPAVVVADSIGAGDSFMAGLIDALSRHDSLDRAALSALDERAMVTVLDHALRVAGITVSRPGADPPWKDEL